MMGDYYNDYLQLFEEIDEIEDVANINFIRHVKFYKFRNNPFDLPEEDFKNKYRFCRATANFIINMAKNELAGDARGGHIPPHIKVLTAIRVWGRGEIQDDAGDLGGMSQPSVSLICKQVALALVAKRADWISMPQNDQEQNHTIAGFYSICGFRQVIGAIDCTHIRIPKVSGNIGQYYINRKGYSSINVQVVSNADLKIMDIVAHWRGSTHDSRIFNESRIKRRLEQSEFKGRLFGASGSLQRTEYLCTLSYSLVYNYIVIVFVLYLILVFGYSFYRMFLIFFLVIPWFSTLCYICCRKCLKPPVRFLSWNKVIQKPTIEISQKLIFSWSAVSLPLILAFVLLNLEM